MNVQLMQLVLVAVMLALGGYAFKLRTVLYDRLLVIAAACAGIVFAAAPDLATWLAHRMGIGRGVDFLLYLFAVFCLFRFVAISAELKNNERRTTAIVRALAMKEAQRGSEIATAAAQRISPRGDKT